jgi:hypothetical protein
MKSNNGLSHHITKTHNISVKEYYDTYLLKSTENICPICGNENNFQNITKGYSNHCSVSCAHLDKDVQIKYKDTMKNRYGFEHFFQNDITRNKAYVSHNYTDTVTVSSFSNPDVIQKLSEIRDNKIQKFENENDCTQFKKINEKYNSVAWKSLNLPQLKLGRDLFIENKYLKQIDDFMIKYELIKYQGISLKEKDIVNTITNFYNGTIITNSRKIIYPYEIDIYLPDLNIAVEFNGTWYHSINAGKSKDYHLMKSKLCRDKNIRLIHIYEFEDLTIQKQLLKDLILGQDNYPKNDYNKNNLLNGFDKVKPEIINTKYEIVYGVGKLYNQ